MLIRWHSSPVTGNPKHRMDNPNPREEEELVITDFVYAGKPWSDIADIANIPNTGADNPIAEAETTLSLTHVPSML